MRNPLLRILVCVVAAALASCIDGHEEIWLNRDGSGRAEVTYSLPASAARFQGGESGIRKMVDDFLRDTPAISSFSTEVTTEGDRLQITVRTTFDSALELKNLSDSEAMRQLPSSAAGLTGEFVIHLHGLSVDFSRTVKVGEALPGVGFMPVSSFKDRELTYIIHLPEAATDSNATRVEDSGRTLVWEVPLAVAIQKPFVTRFTAPVPIPRWIRVCVIGFAGIIGVLILRKFLRRKSRAV